MNRWGRRYLMGWVLLALAPACVALPVKVVDAAGEPVAHAVVALFPREDRNLAEGAPDGPGRAEVDQRDRQFVPYVSAVRTGTEIHFPNSDNIRHHVYSFSPAKRFELRLYHGSTADPVQFDTAGKVVLGCNIHDDMLAYIYVLDTPHFAVTDHTGRADFAALPGTDWAYEIQHPRLATSVTGILAKEPINIGPLGPDPRQTRPRTELEALFDR